MFNNLITMIPRGSMTSSVYTAIGLMSGTSMDGVDAALIRTDGDALVETGPSTFVPYPALVRAAIRSLLGGESRSPELVEIERTLTEIHATAVSKLVNENSLSIDNIDIIGFHGHTVVHRPEIHRTWQIGDAGLLARSLGCDVVADFRTADVNAGGQGAPLAPLFHAALGVDLIKPLAVLNIGGVANVTWIGNDRLLAFDTGPGNGLLDDWVSGHGQGTYDADGAISARGLADPHLLTDLLSAPYFRRAPPKSLDRLDFDLASMDGLSLEDGAATLAGFTVGAVMSAREHFPEPARRWLVTGGGRHNRYIMSLLEAGLRQSVDPVEAVGWQGDALEAQAFAYLAVRSLRGLPLSLPETTGVAQPTCGGVLFRSTR
jgi:anhydro-N-acetylmuramic acid kinase